MDESTFLELPLDRDLYRPKEFVKYKNPLHVLITEAGTKVAYNLMYQICSGKVFGPDQGIILHLVNAKGARDHKSSILELEECGFHLHVDSIVHSEAQLAYSEVDVVVMIALFEEIAGHSIATSFLNQIVKARQVARNMMTYAKPSAKLVLCGPSTKGLAVLLTSVSHFEPELCHSHVSSVVMLDEVISKSLLASQLRTTTDKIKNIVIWGAAHPDTQNATVLMYPPDDNGKYEKVEVPLVKAIDNHQWLHSEFITTIYRRTMIHDLVRSGKAVALAAAKHLKLLFQESETTEEIISMGTLVPSSQPYGIEKNIGFALPVFVKNGIVSVREDVSYHASTCLMNIRTVHNFVKDPILTGIQEMILLITKHERFTREDYAWSEQESFAQKYLKLFEPVAWASKLVITPNPGISSIIQHNVMGHKSITWDDIFYTERLMGSKSKSIIRLHSKLNKLK